MRKVYAQKKLCAYLGSLRIFAYACFQTSNISDTIRATDKESTMAPRARPEASEGHVVKLGLPGVEVAYSLHSLV